MNETEITSAQSRIVAPRLRRIDNHPWGWVSLSDLAELFNKSASVTWEVYCADAAAATRAENWDGKAWKFAQPNRHSTCTTYQVLNVWDMKTGKQSTVPADLIADVLIPSGWSKARLNLTDRIEKALSDLFNIQSSPTADRFLKQRFYIIARERSVSAKPSFEEILATIGTYGDLELALSQLQSVPGGMQIAIKEEHEDSKITITFSHPERSIVAAQLTVRLVLGSVKLLNLIAYCP
jgi:hypothetical protein